MSDTHQHYCCHFIALLVTVEEEHCFNCYYYCRHVYVLTHCQINSSTGVVWQPFCYSLYYIHIIIGDSTLQSQSSPKATTFEWVSLSIKVHDITYIQAYFLIPLSQWCVYKLSSNFHIKSSTIATVFLKFSFISYISH